MITLTEETYSILQKIVKLDDEYNELIERQNKGEFVSDLINQNRYLVKFLHEQDKKNCEEFRLLKEAEKNRKSEKRIQDEQDALKWLAKHPDIEKTLPKKRKERRKKKKRQKEANTI